MKKMSILSLALAASIGIASVAFAAPAIVNETKIVRSGVFPTPVSADLTNGNAITLTSGNLLRIKNLDAINAITVTFADQHTNREGYKTNATFVLGASAIGYCGPFIATRWADGNKLLQFSYSGGTVGAQVENLRLPYGETESTTK